MSAVAIEVASNVLLIFVIVCLFSSFVCLFIFFVIFFIQILQWFVFSVFCRGTFAGFEFVYIPF